MSKTFILPSICLLLAAAAYAEPRSVTAIPTTEGMVIDGELSEAAWSSAPVSAPLVEVETGEPVPVEYNTTFRVLYDESGVYVGIHANEIHADMLGGKNSDDIDSVSWLHDELEVFLDTRGDGMEYYQVALNPGTARADYYYTEGGKAVTADWNPDWKAVTYIGKDFYSAEFYIPFAALHRRPLRTGQQDWLINVARQRVDATQHKLSVHHPTSERLVARYDPTRMLKHQFSCFNQPRSGQGFHDPDSWGEIRGITVPDDMVTVSAGEPVVVVEKVDDAYQAIFSLGAVNHGRVAQTLDLTATMQDRSVTHTLTLAGGESLSVSLPPLAVDALEEVNVRFEMTDAESGDQRYANTAILELTYRPIDIVLRTPAYRNTIYFSETIDEIQGEIVLDVHADRLQGAELSVAFRDQKQVHATLEIPVDGLLARLNLPAADLPVGDYRIDVVLRDAAGETVAEASETLSKVGPPPGIEARVDSQGVFRLNGVPMFLRGFSGRTGYVVPSVAMDKIALPRAVNFVSGGELGLRYGTYGLVDFSESNGALLLERLAQQDKPLTDELKEEFRQMMRDVKYDKNIIGYMIADEPEARSMSPDTLKELYDLIKEEDPYRVGIIVSKDAKTYIDGCDVIAAHPYMGPQLSAEGKRSFKQDFDYAHRVMDAVYEVVNGRGKALWYKPQVFSYHPRDPVGVQPTFEEARWQIWSGVANHAMSVWASEFSYYWNDPESRIGVTAIYETLAMLEIPWVKYSEEIPVTVSTDNDGALDVLARRHAPTDRPAHVYIVAVNRSGKPTTASIAFDGIEKFKRLYVLREDRTIERTGQGFVDTFDTLGVHVYTTSDVWPRMKTLADIQAEIDAVKNTFRADNLLRNGSTDWQRGDDGRNARIYGDRLADGFLNAAGWYEWFTIAQATDPEGLMLVFPKGVAFKELIFHSNNIKDARLEVLISGEWTELAHWQDIHTEATSWQGDTVQADKVRITVDQVREGSRDWTWSSPCITELEMF